MVQVTVEKVAIDEKGEQAIVLLRDLARTTYVPLWIRSLEASNIALQLGRVSFPRPLTVDLLVELTEKLKGQIVMATITEIKNDVFHAALSVDHKDGDFDMDCRPSDAIAIALKVGAPIYVDEKVMAEAGVLVEDGDFQ